MEWIRSGLKKLGEYKYVALVALVGAVLLLWPGGGETEANTAAKPAEEAAEWSALEEKLERALSEVEGAGEVTVVLSVAEGPRRVLARDGSAEESTTSTVSKGAGSQEPVELQTVGPVYRGALVVAQGGGDPSVCLALCRAVSALTGLGTDRITVCKGK